MIFTGTDHEYSVEDYLFAVAANLLLNIEPESNYTILHQIRIYRRTAVEQITLNGLDQEWFSDFPKQIKHDWKRFTQKFSKCNNAKKINSDKKFLIVKSAVYQSKQLSN